MQAFQQGQLYRCGCKYTFCFSKLYNSKLSSVILSLSFTLLTLHCFVKEEKFICVFSVVLGLF